MDNLTNPNFGQTFEERLTPSIARFDRLRDSIMQSMRVALPGIVQTFTPGPPATVSVLIATDEYAMYSIHPAGDQLATRDLSPSTRAFQLPLLQDLPVIMPGGGGWGLTFPIQPGDECLVLFADTPIDVWFQNGNTKNAPISQRRHDLSDGVALFALRSTPRGIANYSTSSAQLRSDDGTVVIDLATNNIRIKAPNVTVISSANVQVTGEDVTITGADVVKIEADTKIVVNGANHTIIDGINFKSHFHGGVQAGAAATGVATGPGT